MQKQIQWVSTWGKRGAVSATLFFLGAPAAQAGIVADVVGNKVPAVTITDRCEKGGNTEAWNAGVTQVMDGKRYLLALPRMPEDLKGSLACTEFDPKKGDAEVDAKRKHEAAVCCRNAFRRQLKKVAQEFQKHSHDSNLSKEAYECFSDLEQGRLIGSQACIEAGAAACRPDVSAANVRHAGCANMGFVLTFKDEGSFLRGLTQRGSDSIHSAEELFGTDDAAPADRAPASIRGN